MGVPAGHPFFGNQYTDGNYVRGSFTYVPVIVEHGADTIKMVADGISKSILTEPQKRRHHLQLSIKNANNNIIIIGIVSLGSAICGYLAYRYFKSKAERKEAARIIELGNVGICTHCGEPLSGSVYIPESKTASQEACIVCGKCGYKNFAWYPDAPTSEIKE